MTVVEAILRFFASGCIDPDLYRDRVASTPGPDPADRVHTAACVGGAATALLTKNIRDLPHDHLAAHGVALLTADEFLAGMFRRRPTDVMATLRRMASEKHRPPRTPRDIVVGLPTAGATRFAHDLGRRLGCPE